MACIRIDTLGGASARAGNETRGSPDGKTENKRDRAYSREKGPPSTELDIGLNGDSQSVLRTSPLSVCPKLWSEVYGVVNLRFFFLLFPTFRDRTTCRKC